MILASCRKHQTNAEEFFPDWEKRIWDSDAPTSDSENGTGKFISRQELTGKVKGNKVLVLVHGYNSARASRTYAEIKKNEENWVAHYDMVVGFLWPGGDSSGDYELAWKNIDASAVALREVLALLLANCGEIGTISHSFGCRLSLKAFGGLDEEFIESLNGKINRQFLFAPAVGRESIEYGREFHEASDRSTTCHVFYTNNDGVLNLGGSLFMNEDFSLGTDGPPRRTSDGVTQGFNISDKVYGINCTHQFLDEGSKHSAYKNNQMVFEYIGEVVKGKGVRRFL